ncbi:MAG: hypothetical protein ACRDHK_03135 [Actinomycetota bacterium]
MSDRLRVNGILLLYHDPRVISASMVLDLVHAFSRYSRFRVWAVNTELGFPRSIGPLEFEVVVLHYSVFAWKPYFLSEEFLGYLDESATGRKVAFFQDEYRFWPERAAFLNRYNVDCVYTCVEPPYYKDTYQRHTKVPRLVTYIPGYVSEEMVRWGREAAKPDRERRVDIGYRGRQAFPYMGKGAREKHDIGVRFLERAAESGLVMDIGTEEHRRIYGKRWITFLADCRAALGVEAGVSIFDIDNVVLPACERILAENPDISLEELHDWLLASYDGHGVYYRTVSPRVFEAASARTCQILYEGKYSGIIEPMIHYIPLKKDFSNFDEVITRYRDEDLRHHLVENSYRDLISSDAYSYRSFITRFDEELLGLGMDPDVHGAIADRVTRDLARDRRWNVRRVGLQARARFVAAVRATDAWVLKALGFSVVRQVRRILKGRGGKA